MADYPIISDVSSYIVRMLREKMCPEPIPSPNNIEISSPASQDVDYIVGLYLYDIREDMEVAQPKRIQKGRIQLLFRHGKNRSVISANVNLHKKLFFADIHKYIHAISLIHRLKAVPINKEPDIRFSNLPARCGVKKSYCQCQFS